MSLSASVYMDYLSREGYHPILDADGDVTFKAEGRLYYIDIDTDDERFFRLVYPNFWRIEGGDDYARAIIAATIATRQIKVVKVYLRNDDKNVSAAVELIVPHPEQFGIIFPRMLRILRAGVEKFVESMK